MSVPVALSLDDGTVELLHMSPDESFVLQLVFRRLVGLSDNISQLTNVTRLWLHGNALVQLPEGALSMHRLTSLAVNHNRLVSLPPDIGRFAALTELYVNHNRLAAFPREIGQLRALEALYANNNALESLPAEFGKLESLERCHLEKNRLTWLPAALQRLGSAVVFVDENPLPLVTRDHVPALSEIFAATTTLSMLRSEATEICVGLAELELPALVTLEIIDAAWTNGVRMYAKWELVTAVKHFHDRRNAQR